MKGWISLHRSIEEHWLYPKGREFTKYEAWIDILLQVNHAEKKVMIKDELFLCKRGDSVRSLKEWGKRWGWSRNKVRRFLELLEKDSMIVLRPDTKTTHLTVCNYDTYQVARNSNGHQTDTARTSDGHQTDTNNNVNNYNNVNNVNKTPTIDLVINYFKESGVISKKDIKAESRRFMAYYEEMNWKKNNIPINWINRAGRWETTYTEFKLRDERKHQNPF